MTGLCISLFVVVVAVKGTCFFFCFDCQCKTPHCMSASRPVMCKIHSFFRSLTKIHPSIPPPPWLFAKTDVSESLSMCDVTKGNITSQAPVRSSAAAMILSPSKLVQHQTK